MSVELAEIHLVRNKVNRPPISIINATSTSGTVSNYGCQFAGTKPILSGALTANVLVTALSLTGEGCISVLSLSVRDATSRQIRAKVTIDGIVVYDSTSSTITTSLLGLLIVGLISSTSNNCTIQNVFFNQSLIVEISSSLTEIDRIQLNAAYILS